MDEEKWNELLKLRDKANLAPQTDSRFTRLEDFIFFNYYLSTYSQKEIEGLLAQYSELSDQEKSALISRATTKTNPSFFHLTYEEMEKLQAGRKELSFHERARLSDKLVLTATGTAWLDLGDVFEAEIEIDDNSSAARETHPYAYIYFSDGYRRRVETVDILESVKTNPASIGHPAIVSAIYHWQRVVYAKRIIERDDVTSRDEIGKTFKNVFGGIREVRIAEANLKSLGKALAEGAIKRAIPNDLALAFQIKSQGLELENKRSVLYRAWERLHSKFIEPTDERKQVLSKIEADLHEFEKQPYINSNGQHISVNRVMEFLRKGGKKGGKRFVGNNTEGYSLRPSWKVFRNAFAAWFFDLTQASLQDYLEKAAKQNLADHDIYEPTWARPKSYVAGIWGYLLSIPLVAVREPVLLLESEIGVQGIEKAIKDAALNAAKDD